MSSIRIVPESERSASVIQPNALLLPSAATPYTRRSARLRQLAVAHPMADYLLWAADLVEVQAQVVQSHPLPEGEGRHLAQVLRAQNHTPLNSQAWERSVHWQLMLDQLLAGWAERASMQSLPVQQALQALRSTSHEQRNRWADGLLASLRGEADSASELPAPAIAQLLYAALSPYWRQLAQHLPAAGNADLGEERHLCPVCGHAPTGSLVLDGAHAGLRYLQCSLCESQWHVVRSKCTNCDGSSDLDYWCLDSEKAALKAEACNDCQSYLKLFSLPGDRSLEMQADDLASLALDAEMDTKGLARSGINPLMLP